MRRRRPGRHGAVRTLELTAAARADLGLQLEQSYAGLPPAFHKPAQQLPLEQARVFAFNRPLAEQLGLNPGADNDSLLQAFNAQGAVPGARPIHMAYGGHQFGVWVPQLGDGRGLLLGELIAPDGEHIDLHLKGSGAGDFSRGFDGRAVLRSTVREYLCSEAMHHLGIPTTRALCLIASQEAVRREQIEPGALLVRTARSHVRFGTFEYFHHRSDHASVEVLVDYVLRRHFPQLAADGAAGLLEAAITATARTLAAWQVVGFCHGVMNTDNMSILGDTLDYGPFGFMDHYNPGHICNSSDHSGRYAYNRQPAVGLWNCQALAVALSSLVPGDRASELLGLYEPEFLRHYCAGIGRRLGIADAEVGDLPLISDWLTLMATASLDFNLGFRQLADALEQGRTDDFAAATGLGDALVRWHDRWRERAGQGGPDLTLMRQSNPALVLRNAWAQAAIEGAMRGDATEFDRLLEALRHPFEAGDGRYTELPPAEQCGTSLSCSS